LFQFSKEMATPTTTEEKVCDCHPDEALAFSALFVQLDVMTDRELSRPRARALSLASALTLTCIATRAGAAVEFPRRNPKAKVIQHVGLTEVSVEYNSLAVRGRSIWGGVVPYGQLWLTGETPASKITFSRDVVLDGQKVLAGTYALLVSPAEDDWTLIVNANVNLAESSKDYRPELDVARVKVHAQSAPLRERLTFLFSDFTDEQALLDLEWEKRHVSLPIKVDTRQQILASIGALDDVWRGYANVARYMLETKKDYDAGLAYIGKSIALRETWYNDWIMASLLAAKGRYAEARDRADRGYQAGRAGGDESFSEVEISRALADWSRAADRASPTASSTSTSKPGDRSSDRKASAAVAKASFPLSGTPPISVPVLVIDDERAAPRFSPGRASASVTVAPKAGEIAPVVERGKADVQACYERALRQDLAPTRGRVSLSIGIGTSGLVKSVVLNSPRQYRVLEPCVKQAVSHWVFPPSTEEYGAEIPIVLQGKSKE
jgi:Protein of unknown function (DUF2911)